MGALQLIAGMPAVGVGMGPNAPPDVGNKECLFCAQSTRPIGVPLMWS